MYSSTNLILPYCHTSNLRYCYTSHSHTAILPYLSIRGKSHIVILPYQSSYTNSILPYCHLYCHTSSPRPISYCHTAIPVILNILRYCDTTFYTNLIFLWHTNKSYCHTALLPYQILYSRCVHQLKNYSISLLLVFQ